MKRLVAILLSAIILLSQFDLTVSAKTMYESNTEEYGEQTELEYDNSVIVEEELTEKSEEYVLDNGEVAQNDIGGVLRLK